MPSDDRDPYTAITCPDDLHAHYQALAADAADKIAKALARGEMRLGVAHRYLFLAHLEAYCDGAGDDAAQDFLEAVLDTFRAQEEASAYQRELMAARCG